MSSSGSQPPDIQPCLEWDPRIPNPFGYHPSLAWGITFSVLFIGSFGMHCWQAYKYRKWWLLAFSMGALGEVSGWVSRIASYKCPYSVPAFEAQLASLITAPAFTTAGIYSILAMMIPILGEHNSPLKPRRYLTIFLTVDFFSLLLQGVGGGLAGAAFSQEKDTSTATTIMVTGIIFQLASTVVFVTLLEFVLYRSVKILLHNRPLLILALATLLSVTCMVIRGVYRSMELLQGWRGFLITNERFFIALEGLLMAIAVIVFNVFHPERLLRQAREVAMMRDRGNIVEMDNKANKKTAEEIQDGRDEGSYSPPK